MAAFIDGKLAPSELARIATHLRGCPDCRTVVGETARFEREESAQTTPKLHPGTVRAWGLAAAAAIGGAIALTVLLLPERSPIQILVDAAPRGHRRVEARLSSFAWAPVKAPQRGASSDDPADLKLAGAVGEVLEQTNRQDDSGNLHARGVANLLIRETAKSIAALERAAKESNEARIWSDLAAARFELSARDDRTSVVADALAAADKAIQLDPDLPEAHFNRALILDHMGALPQAREEWERYLQLDPSSEWSVEARTRLRALEKESATFDFKGALQQACIALRHGDRAPLQALARGHPEEGRTWAEAILISDWADAEVSGDVPLAAERLLVVRTIGETLAENGEHLLLDAVTAIDRADPRDRAGIAAAQLIQRAARLDYRRGQIAKAEDAFRHAQQRFRAAGHPFADVALYFSAATALEAGRVAEAADSLTRLRARVDRTRHRALAAQLAWDLARCATKAGDWGTATREASTAASLFRELGELGHAAFMDATAAHALERIGERDLAWDKRASALRTTRDGNRRQAILQSGAQALAASDRLAAAESVMDVMIASGRDNPEMFANALADRARFAERNGSAQASGKWLEEARRAAGEIPDPALRESTQAQVSLVAAVLERGQDPRGAIRSFDQVIELYTERGLGMRLPGAYLERARAHRAAGDDEAALADYRSAAQRFMEERNTVADLDVRPAFLDGAAEIIEETVELHLARGEAEEAFLVTDGARGWLDRSLKPAPLPARMAVVEYAMLRQNLAIFCAVRGGVTAQTVPVDRATLAARVLELSEQIRSASDVASIRVEVAALYRLLILPVSACLAGIDEVVIVPDRELHGLPFAALLDERTGRFLVQDYTLRFAPSSRGSQLQTGGALRPAVVIADPTTSWLPLPHSRREASEVAAMHDAALIIGNEATRSRFLAAAAGSALIHYAGHADSNAAESYGALLLAPNDGDDGILGASEIARLPLRHRPLVVLSACGTFQGSGSHVAGMPSIARAFLKAGARAVVGTLWEVDDDLASALFTKFHLHLRADMAPARALQSAQIDMLQSSDPRLSHPSTWSPVGVLSNL